MSFIISCLTNSYGRFGARGAIECLPKAGIDYVELPIRTEGVPSIFKDEPLVTTASTAPELKEVDRMLAGQGLRVSACNISSGNPLDPEVVKITKRKLDLAEHFGVSLVVGGAGEAGDEEQLQELYGHLLELGDYAAQKGITYCFETHPGICVNHREMLKTMADLDHPNLKINYDTANIFYYNENILLDVSLYKICHEVRHFHLKDSQGVPGEWYFPALGDAGGVDFVQVLMVMRGCAFEGPYSIELEGIEGEPELSLEQYHNRIERSMNHLRTCGFLD